MVCGVNIPSLRVRLEAWAALPVAREIPCPAGENAGLRDDGRQGKPDVMDIRQLVGKTGHL